MRDDRAALVRVLSIVLLVLALLWLKRAATKQDVLDLARIIRLGPAKALVTSIEQVKPGDTKDQVERLLGKADSPSAREWVYYLDEHSGYLINFDNRDRVELVETWRV